jgi:DNA-binding SARP family transcriptional activator/Tfp pilus assembly protein PilF
VRLLGPPAWRRDGQETPWSSERPYLLLALLACRRDWVGRDELADTLYPGRDIAAARSNLRKVLFLARQLEGAEALEQRGDLLRWTPESDLAPFEVACGAQRHAEAVALYAGPLLLGLDAAFPGETADWLHAERQRLQARWHEACRRRLVELAGEPAAASELAQAMLRADPLDETALQALARAQQALGRPADALAALRGYEQRLSHDVGLPPSAAVQALGDELQGQARPPVGAEAASAAALMVGRRQELARIAERLAEPGCRVLTLLGGPGVGKSTLARAAQTARVAASLWVPLEDLQQADQVPERIASLAGLTLAARQPPWPALAQALGGRPLLLVLDNAEHLPLAAELGPLLAACPALQLLVASREPVGVAGEWRLPITGLPLPDADETDAEVLRANDAVRLFERRARPLAPAFDLAAEAADVVRLVHEVEGLPLALELLAAWRRLMPVREILAELAESLDLLEPATPSERSVRASFARAWQQLSPLEQRVLAQMAALPAPMSRAQVRSVLQAPLPVVAALADRSLVRAEDDGSFTLHPLIRRCAAPLAPELPALRERHARELVQRAKAHDVARVDLNQVREAWQWAVEQADAGLMLGLAWLLKLQLRHRATVAEGLDLLQAGRAALLRGPAPPANDAARALARVGFCIAELLYDQSDLPAAQAAALDSAEWARQVGDPVLEASPVALLCSVEWQSGRPEAALVHIDRALALDDRPHLRARRALVLKALGRYDEAREIQEAALAESRRRGELRHNLATANNLANLLRLMGRPREALELAQEALQLARTPGDPTDEPYLLTNLALIHETLRDFDTAARRAAEAVRSARERGGPVIEACALATQARVWAVQQRPRADCLAVLLQALAIARRVGSESLEIELVADAGAVLAHSGQRVDGLALVRWAQRQPALHRSSREDAEQRLKALGIDASEEAAALRRLTPKATLTEALALVPGAMATR